MRPFIALLVLCFALSACALIKPIARTSNDVAGTLCEIVAAEQEPEALGGMSVEDWCAIHDNVDPFLDIVLSAKAEAAEKAGFAKDAGVDEPAE